MKILDILDVAVKRLDTAPNDPKALVIAAALTSYLLGAAPREIAEWPGNLPAEVRNLMLDAGRIERGGDGRRLEPDLSRLFSLATSTNRVSASQRWPVWPIRLAR